MIVHSQRVADYEIHPQFVARWSPRSFAEQPVSSAVLARLFEAARWAPSAHNLQPWRWLWSVRGDSHWVNFARLPNERNQVWARGAGALLVLLSDTASGTHSLDAGCAWGFLALQASEMGLATHAMAGIDRDRIRAELQVPDNFAVEAMVAVGYPGAVEMLPEPLRGREHPSPREPQATRVARGSFRFPSP